MTVRQGRVTILQKGNDKRFEELLEGNRRFFEGRSINPRASRERRMEIAGGQKPFAAVLACSDSRVPPEILFDQGLGDLFIVRTAGNAVDEAALGSIEYAVAHLGVSLVVVLGHTDCGAVRAAVKGGGAEGHMGSILEALRPAVEDARRLGGNIHDLAARRNVETAVAALRSSEPVLAPLEDRLDIVGCYYDLETGRIRVIC